MAGSEAEGSSTRSPSSRWLEPGRPSRACRAGLLLAIFVAAGVMTTLGWLRYATYHNLTFDLAFYTRMAWGMARGNFWEPFLGASVFGVHLSPILIPLGWLGVIFGTPFVLITAQALSAAFAAWPLALFGARRLGVVGACLGAATILVFPNLFHVTTYEAHPGTMALCALAWLVEALDRRDAKLLVLAAIGVLLCREDFSMVLVVAGVVAQRDPATRSVGRGLAAFAALYFLAFAFVLLPLFGPDKGSFGAHFGKWGGGLGTAIGTWLTSPLLVLEHLSSPSRLLYLPKLFAPLAFLPLLGARWLWLAVPTLAINLMSDFPTTTRLYSHYLTPALPFLGAAAIVGLERAVKGLGTRRAIAPVALPSIALGGALLLGHIIAGGTPLSVDFDAASFRADAHSAVAASTAAAIPRGVSVQAPDALLPHLAERPAVHRMPPPDRGGRFIVLDLRHRARFFGDESLLRTLEEPRVRDWLAKNVAVRHVNERYLVLERGVDPRQGIGADAIVERDRMDLRSRRVGALCGCLDLLGARIVDGGVELDLLATGACPHDLAIRLGAASRPTHVDLLFGGALSPAHLRAGDRLRSSHRLSIEGHRLYVGALRSSGAPPEKSDPIAIPLALAR